MKKIDVSIIIITKNFFLAELQYENFKNSSLNFEVIVVGPSNYKNNNPNFKFFESYCKPAQCAEIALTKISGKWLIFWPDDIFFINKKKNLDMLIKLAEENPKNLMSLRLNNKLNKNINSYRFTNYDLQSPLIGVACPIQKKVLKKIGSINKNFIATLWDADLYMRLMTIGFKTKFTHIYINEKTNYKYSLNKDYLLHDRKYLDFLWVKKDKNKIIYLKKINYSRFDKRKLNKPQGPNGRWILNNKYYYKYIIIPYFFLFKKIFPVYKIYFYFSYLKTLINLIKEKYFKN